jgi:hypothetical protein
MSKERRLTRKQMLAADVFAYSYANYAAHLGIGNLRFDKLMPDDIDILEIAEQGNWDASELAEALDIPKERVASYQDSYRETKEIVDAPTLAESFRRGVLSSIQYAVEQGLGDRGSIERLATQICYRAADFAFRLDMEGQQLSDYSEELRRETKYDEEDQEAKIRRDIQES